MSVCCLTLNKSYLRTNETTMNQPTAVAMDAQKIKTLLNDSEERYKERLLKKAANTAQIALDFGQGEQTPPGDLIHANVLLCRIYTTNGIYQGKESFLKQALQYITAAKKLMLDHLEHTERLPEILLYEGITYSYLGQFEEAQRLFNESVEISGNREDEKGIFRALIAMSKNELLQNNFSEALQLANDAFSFLSESAVSADASLKAEAAERIAEAHIKSHEYSESLEYSQQLLTLARKIGDIEKELTALKFIAIVCGVKANYKIGMQYFFEALDKSEQIEYRPNTAQILVNIATIYAHLYNYDDALARYQRVLEEFDDVIDSNTRTAVYNNAGNIYYATDRHKQALGCFKRSLALAEEGNFSAMIVHSLAQLSRAYCRMEDFPTAQLYAQKAEEHLESTGIENGRQIHLLNLSKLALHAEEYERALEYGKAGVASARKLKDDVSELRGYRSIANIYKAMRDFENALDYQTRYSRLQEDFSKTQRNRRFLDLEIRHAIKEQQKEIKALTKENEYQSLLLEQSDQIARQNEELLSANEDLRQFAYVASHDLKEPLRMISSYSQLIERFFGADLPEDKKQYFTYIKDGTKRMSTLLDDLLRYASIGKSSIDKEAIDVNRTIEICCFNLKVRIEENNAKIDVSDLPEVYTNKPLFTQLLQNLLSNAVKFRRPDVDPIVLVRCEEKEEEYIFSVADNGIGIPEEFKERIFVIFQRLHSRNKYEGTGIGLAICQKITQKLGGRLWLESEEGVGSTFYFSLPKR